MFLRVVSRLVMGRVTVRDHNGLASGRTGALPDCQDLDDGRFPMDYPPFVGILDYVRYAVGRKKDFIVVLYETLFKEGGSWCPDLYGELDRELSLMPGFR
jgi:hypothetical protein